MRPKKRILLVARGEDLTGRLRYLLHIHGYKVLAVHSATDAALVLRMPDNAPILLVIVVWPLRSGRRLLRFSKAAAPGIATLLVSPEQELAGILPLPWAADATLFRPAFSSDKLLRLVKLLTAQKRGPRPQKGPSL